MTYNQAPTPTSEMATTGPWTMQKIETAWGNKKIETTILKYKNSSGDDLTLAIHNYPDGFGGPKWRARVLSTQGIDAEKKFYFYEVTPPEGFQDTGDNKSWDATSLSHQGKFSETTLQSLFENPYSNVDEYNQTQGKYNPLKPRPEYNVKDGAPAQSSRYEWNGVMSNFQPQGSHEITDRERAFSEIGVDPQEFSQKLLEIGTQVSAQSLNRR